MYRLKKCFRYPLSDAFMIIGIVIGFMALFIGITAFEKMNMSQSESAIYKYSNQIVVSLVSEDGTSIDMGQVLENVDINAEIVNYSIVMGEYTRLCEVCYAYNTEPPYRLSEGRYPTDEDIASETRVVNIGRDHVRYTYEKNGKSYIDINGVAYEVIGVFEGEKSEALNYLIYFVYDCMDEVDKDIIDNLSCISIRFGSDEVNVREFAQDVIANLNENIRGSLEDSSSYSLVIVDKETTEKFYFYIYVFAIVICIIISELWIYERKEEIAVLKTTGFSVFNIAERVYKSLFFIVMVGAIISWVLVFVTYRLMFGYFMEMNVNNMCVVLMCAILSSMAIFIIPLNKISKCEVAKTINTRGEY